jgi:hypothetical protein
MTFPGADPRDLFVTSQGKVSLPLLPHDPVWEGKYVNKQFGICSNVANKGAGLYYSISKIALNFRRQKVRSFSWQVFA